MFKTHHILGHAAAPSLFALRGIRFIEGEDGGAPPAPPAPEPTPEPPAPPAPKPAPPAQQPQQDRSFDQSYVKELREEAKGYRTERDAARTEKEALDRENQTLKAQLAARDRLDAITKAAKDSGANADLLLDSRGFEAHMKDVNITDAEAVAKAITEWVEKNPGHKATPALPGKSGGAGHAGDQDNTKPKTLEEAVAASLN